MKWLNKNSAHALALVSLLAVAACTKHVDGNGSPEAALESYVKTVFSAKSVDDAKKLLDMSTGDAREWLASMSEEAFRKQFVENKMVLQSFSMKDLRKEKDGDVSLVYEIAFKEGSPDGKPTSPAVFTNKKIAYLTKDGEGWKIRATKNIKSYIERKDALEIPPGPPAVEETKGGKP